MSTDIKHNYFWDLSTKKIDFTVTPTWVIYEKFLWEIEVCIWADENQNLDEKSLDLASEFIKNFEKNLENYRKEIEKYLEEDSEYMDFHLEEFDDLNFPNEISNFVKIMQITSINIWLQDNIITVDFMISKEYSDEILCLKFDIEWKLKDIAWES